MSTLIMESATEFPSAEQTSGRVQKARKESVCNTIWTGSGSFTCSLQESLPPLDRLKLATGLTNNNLQIDRTSVCRKPSRYWNCAAGQAGYMIGGESWSNK